MVPEPTSCIDLLGEEEKKEKETKESLTLEKRRKRWRRGLTWLLHHRSQPPRCGKKTTAAAREVASSPSRPWSPASGPRAPPQGRSTAARSPAGERARRRGGLRRRRTSIFSGLRRRVGREKGREENELGFSDDFGGAGVLIRRIARVTVRSRWTASRIRAVFGPGGAEARAATRWAILAAQPSAVGPQAHSQKG